MGTQFAVIFYNILIVVRWVGAIVIVIVTTGLLVTEAARSRLSPTRVVGVACTGIFAVVLIWTLPSLANYARTDANRIVPDQPVGGVYGH